jgi:peptide/nickel transport system permease protein
VSTVSPGGVLVAPEAALAAGEARRLHGTLTVLRRLASNPLSSAGLALLAVFVVCAVAAPLVAPHDPNTFDGAAKFLHPSASHPFGTDDAGRDVLSRVVYGTRYSLTAALAILAFAAVTGTAIGLVAGYAGGWADEALMRVTDMFLAFPPLILALAINAALGPGLTQAMLAVAISWWPSYARMVRGQVLSTKEEEYVTAARVVGVPPHRLVLRHILLNSFPPVLVQMTLDVGFITLTTAGLSFLGLGVTPPTPEWGRMVADGHEYLLNQWWWTTFPGLAIFLVVVGSNLLGDVIRESLDPSLVNR